MRYFLFKYFRSYFQEFAYEVLWNFIYTTFYYDAVSNTYSLPPDGRLSADLAEMMISRLIENA